MTLAKIHVHIIVYNEVHHSRYYFERDNPREPHIMASRCLDHRALCKIIKFIYLIFYFEFKRRLITFYESYHIVHRYDDGTIHVRVFCVLH